MVITSVGSPEPVMKPLKDAGCLVLADVASVRHAEKAVAAGVDGLVLLTAGAGGQTGWVNPFAFVRAVRRFWDGIVVMAGGMADGQAVAAAERWAATSPTWAPSSSPRARAWPRTPTSRCWSEPARRREAHARLHRPRDQHAAAVDRGGRPRSRQSARARRDRHRQGHQRRRARASPRPSAGRTSGAPATRSPASPISRRSPSWSSGRPRIRGRSGSAQCRW